jgi:hypothetical protein
MLTREQFQKAKEFIYRYGRLIDRKRFSYHFDNGNGQDVISVLKCYQNPDGGFGNGLELDLMCPNSTAISAEIALDLMIECNQIDLDSIEMLKKWIINVQKSDGSLENPIDEIKKYPHGEWWLNQDDNRVFSIAGFMSKMGIEFPEFYRMVSSLFNAKCNPFPKKLTVYDYPYFIYVNHGPDREKFVDQKETIDSLVRTMLKQEAWHNPLFFCSDRWYSPSIDNITWKNEAAAAISTIKEDGGVMIKEYEKLPWWRPVWTLEMLIRLKKQNLIVW